MAETITNYISFALGALDSMGVRKEVVDQLLYIEQEAARDQAAEDGLTLTDEERSDIDEQTRIDAEQTMIDAAQQAATDPLGVWLDYLYPPKDDRRAADAEIF